MGDDRDNLGLTDSQRHLLFGLLLGMAIVVTVCLVGILGWLIWWFVSVQ
jgi:hypothetical protein